ncbi:MAG TPA: trehalase family glycosidase, partial [Bacteroidales bacterium]|nr:trehalase family glycosidase [Bacteroidales bacterium]
RSSILFGCLLTPLLQAQFLSNLDATSRDALYTTYAAPVERSQYRTDQGYQLLWNDPESGIQLVSTDGGNFGIAFGTDQDLRFRLKEMFREPVVTVSYSDLVRFYYYPYKDIRVEILFDVYSSKTAIADIRIRNEGAFPAEVAAIPYYYAPSSDSLNDISPSSPFSLFKFRMTKKKDSWMREHQIPFTENLLSYLSSDLGFDSIRTFSLPAGKNAREGNGRYGSLGANLAAMKKNAPYIKGLLMSRTFRLQPGDQAHMRIVFGTEEEGMRIPELFRKINPLWALDMNTLIAADEKAYSRIPDPGITDRDSRYLYWSCFSLMRQCMMPPEGECHYNYYVFSREPKWGWGYGGQVFHESLAMTAYAYMDPVGAMNSQRVYFERQQPDGYINYRTGPYLDETIDYHGERTSAAPWFNYENLEIYKVTKDRAFLEEAYRSGRKFYEYYTARRDSNRNGLCEWGGDAELESVRDARVAVWDQAGWPSNFEGPDLNSMLVAEAKALREMATILGYPKEAAGWENDANRRADLINRRLWDAETGFYYNVNRDNGSFTYRSPGDLKRKEIIGFLPLWAGIADRDRAGILMKSLLDPQQFRRRYGIPTLSAQDKYYNPMGYWNGPVWVQWDWLVFRGLLDYGYRPEAEELAKRITGQMIGRLKSDHVFWEFYSPDDAQAGWNKTYIWAGIAARFFLDLQRK